jgi:hypothetical protein
MEVCGRSSLTQETSAKIIEKANNIFFIIEKLLQGLIYLSWSPQVN